LPVNQKSGRRFLAIHPNVELYGSDRSFASAMDALMAASPGDDFTVILPSAGPILTLPVFSRISVRFEAMWILRRKDLTVLKLPGFALRGVGRIIHAWTMMCCSNVVYINTIIPLDYLIASIFSRSKSIIHVREIPTGAEMTVFRQLLVRSRSELVFNSHATRAAFALPAHRMARSHVIYNGVPVPAPYAKDSLGDRPLRVLVIGRLNAWKGQDVLVAALAGMPAAQRARFQVRIVGSVFADQVHFHDRIEAAIAQGGLEGQVEMVPFQDDPAKEYARADIVVVPSTKPEPFGRVAIEAMSYRCAVVASAHGGLTEIVDDGATGCLVVPNDAPALAAALVAYAADPALATAHGEAGYRRFENMFTEAAVYEDVVRIVGESDDKQRQGQQ